MFIMEIIFLLATTSVVVNMAKVSTHMRASTESSPKKGSPRKKDISFFKLNKSKLMHHPNYTFKIIKLKVDIKVIWCEKSPHDAAFIDPLTSDLTLANEEQLEPVNAYIPDYSIMNIIMAMFETADKNWYRNNVEIANDYFVDQLYPHSAVDQLGFLETHGTFQPGFNPPKDM